MSHDGDRIVAPARATPSGRVRLLVALFSVAAAVRLGLLIMEWPASNSDEATTGLMAIHIAEGRHFPSFMYGQSYMGTIQAYLAAAVFKVAGPSPAGLRLPMVVLFLLFLAALYLLASRLYGTTVALVSVGLLTLASRELYGHQLVAQGAIPETLLAGTLLLLFSHRLLATPDTPDHAAGQRWRLAGWGATATLALWSSVLTAPFVLSSAVLVGMAVRRRTTPVRGRLWALGGGLLAGALPWLLHDLTHPWRDSAVVSVLRMYVHGGTGLGAAHSPGLVTQVVNTVTTSLAYVTGGSAIAHPLSRPAWFAGTPGGWTPPTDDIVTTGWGLAVIVLWVAGLVTGVRMLVRRHGAGADVCARLAMLAAAGLTVAAFAASPTPGVAPANNVRYILGALVATPAVIAPLWSLHRFGRLPRSVALALAALTAAVGTVQAYRDAAHSDGETATRQLVAALRREGITHVYGGYLDCNRLTFISREHVVCAVLFENGTGGLGPGLDRYPPYRTEVRSDPRATYVFRSDDPRNAILMRSACHWQRHWQTAGYDIWQPSAPCPVSSGE